MQYFDVTSQAEAERLYRLHGELFVVPGSGLDGLRLARAGDIYRYAKDRKLEMKRVTRPSHLTSDTYKRKAYAGNDDYSALAAGDVLFVHYDRASVRTSGRGVSLWRSHEAEH